MKLERQPGTKVRLCIGPASQTQPRWRQQCRYQRYRHQAVLTTKRVSANWKTSYRHYVRSWNR